MTGKAKAALEEQTIRTLSKKHKNNSNGDSGNMNLKRPKKTLLPGNTPTNGAGSMNEDEPVDKNRPAVVRTKEEENALYKDDDMAEDELYEAYNEDRFVDKAELLDEGIQAVKLVLVKVHKLA
ncbi:uncharacterized protein F5891DRAFT_984322 [Suillus fuscotomentosus]|uniref:Uncharacterized protein n=1 Tax=Suillus fuscotomentosus TaxID=1912939 RepID=A0AAD4HH80_9AGAM|nr:uncharacterized protein F5891DRAFT_984322 [Suillus fuscotomentosus]KAG1895394.1 hypothetical protein F5891DRAFT_984322 [Suillus fuscotomentosus]